MVDLPMGPIKSVRRVTEVTDPIGLVYLNALLLIGQYRRFAEIAQKICVAILQHYNTTDTVLYGAGGRCCNCVYKLKNPIQVEFDDNGQVCIGCSIYKPFSTFPVSRGSVTGRRSLCNRCIHLKHKYQLTYTQFIKMLDLQNYRCKTCKRPLSDETANVDHDHTCCQGQIATCGSCVRAILCSPCNWALGHVQDSKEILEEMIRYVESFRDSKKESYGE